MPGSFSDSIPAEWRAAADRGLPADYVEWLTDLVRQAVERQAPVVRLRRWHNMGGEDAVTVGARDLRALTARILIDYRAGLADVAPWLALLAGARTEDAAETMEGRFGSWRYGPIVFQRSQAPTRSLVIASVAGGLGWEQACDAYEAGTLDMPALRTLAALRGYGLGLLDAMPDFLTTALGGLDSKATPALD